MTDEAMDGGVMLDSSESIREGATLLMGMVKAGVNQQTAASALVGALAIMLVESGDPDKNLDFVVDGLRVCLESAKEAKAMESKVKS
jgi:hypothetical protein